MTKREEMKEWRKMRRKRGREGGRVDNQMQWCQIGVEPRSAVRFGG